MDKVSLAETFARVSDHWSPKVVGELNGQRVKLVKLLGRFVWHTHDHEGERFLVVRGRFRRGTGAALRVDGKTNMLKSTSLYEFHASNRVSGTALGLGVTLLVLVSANVPADSVRSRSFVLTYRAEVRDLPKGAKALDLWLPLPQTDRNQTIRRISIDAPGPIEFGREACFGNQGLHLRVENPESPVSVTIAIQATRRENAGTEERLSDEQRAAYLKPEPLVPLDGPVRALALEATRGLETDAEKARAIYETVVGRMRYDKSGTGWGRGDAVFACDARRGNCTDFHALVIGMARSVGIPARFAIGLPLPRGQNSGEIAGYHCWAELYVRGRGWVPLDASEAAKDPSRKDYFFGHHDEHRLEFSRGRNLVLEPAQQGPPLNFFVYPYAEVDGRPHEGIDREFTFADR